MMGRQEEAEVLAGHVLDAIWGEHTHVSDDQIQECLHIADALVALGYTKTGDGAADAAQTMGGSLPPAVPSPPGPEVIGGQPGPMPRRFQLYRHTDVSQVSGVGVVAWGVQFPDGAAAIRWHGDTPSTVAWNSVDDALKVHGHSGATELRWLDDQPIDLWPAEERPTMTELMGEM